MKTIELHTKHRAICTKAEITTELEEKFEHLKAEGNDEMLSFYEVRLWDENGSIIGYVGKRYYDDDGSEQWLFWYAKTGRINSGYGKTRAEIVKRAAAESFLYA